MVIPLIIGGGMKSAMVELSNCFKQRRAVETGGQRNAENDTDG